MGFATATPKPLIGVEGDIPRLVRRELRQGMSYRLLLDENTTIPNVPPPVARSSLAQVILKHRYQFSRYISRLTRPMSPLPLIGYPEARGQMVYPMAPDPSTSPIPANPPAPFQTVGSGNSGTMRASPRFRKALPARIAVYNPPVYGDGS